MNETQILIKTSIEKEAKQQLGVDIIVEYVPDISLRKQELQKQAGEKFNSVYNADHFSGTFIPAIGNNPYYILVQESRESMLDIMTAFHEYQHLIDYVLFFMMKTEMRCWESMERCLNRNISVCLMIILHCSIPHIRNI